MKANRFKKMTKKQKNLFVSVGEFGFDGLYAEDFKGTIVESLIESWQQANKSLESLYEDMVEEVGDEY